ncbi:MAG TPA: surface-adhesin E family protein [Gallionella sp.]|nr:surface-adhesin E family protein [Gallionella sp.]
MSMKLRPVAMLACCLIAFPAAAAQQFDSEQAAQQHCPSDTVIWQNLRSGSVHAKGQPWYGKTQYGAYVCRKEVTIKGGKVVAEVPPEKTSGKPVEQPSWGKVVEDDERTVYIATSPAAKDGHMVTILSLVDLRKASALGDGTAYLSWETQYRFDCRKRLSRIEAASMYAGNMGAGEVAGSVVYDDQEWKPVPKGSNGELLWKAACGK